MKRNLFLCRQAAVDRFYPTIGLNKSFAPGFPFLGQTFALYLVQSFAGRDLLAHDVGCLLQHAVITLQIVDCRNWTMTGDQFRSLRNFREELADVFD